MPNAEKNNDPAAQADPQSESSALSLEGLAALIETGIDTGSDASEATGSDNNTVEDQSPALDDPLAEELQRDIGDSNRSEENSAEDSGSDDREEGNGIPKHIQKRIDKITAKRREAEAEAERLKAELEKLRNEKELPTPPRTKNPYANVLDDAGLNKALEQARQIRDWCEENPYGGEIPKGNGEFLNVDEAEVRKMKINALKDIEVNIPAQAQFINARRHFDPVAEAEYPWWKKKDTKEYQTAVALLKNFPELVQFPDYKLVIGDFVYGLQSRQMRSAKSSVQQSLRKPQLQPTRPSVSPTANSTKFQNAKEAESRFAQSGSRDDLALLIEARLKSR